MSPIWAFLFIGFIQIVRCDVAVSRIWINYERSTPLAVDINGPLVLGWTMNSSSDIRNVKQLSYQILVSTSLEKLNPTDADLWDSGLVNSNDSVAIQYKGKVYDKGGPSSVYHWKIILKVTYSINGTYMVDSISSSPSFWEQGLLPKDWSAQWISRNQKPPATDCDFYNDDPVPLLRSTFTLHQPSKQITSARAYVSGLGYFQLYINGAKVGDSVLDPAWTSYNKTVYYVTHNITRHLSDDNVVGIMLGNGWYNPLPIKMFGFLDLRNTLAVGLPKAKAQIHILYVDGSEQIIITEPTWKVGNGPIVRNNIYLGEVYDARMEIPDWSTNRYNDSAWPSAAVAEAPVGVLKPQSVPPIKETKRIKPKSINQMPNNIQIVDIGVNYAGWFEIAIPPNMASGSELNFRYGELLYPNGSLNVMTSVCGQVKQGNGGPCAPYIAWQADKYICSGGSNSTYKQTFTWHGFRFVEVTGYPRKIQLDDVTGIVLHSDVNNDGQFLSSNILFNQIQDITRRSFLSNLFGLQSDCPHRERFGYGGDLFATDRATLFNFDLSQIYLKRIADFADDVRANGGFTETAPFNGVADSGLGGNSGPIGWGSVFPDLILTLYQFYGMDFLIPEYYGYVVNWINLLESVSVNYTITNGLGDWSSIAPRDVKFTSTAFFYKNAQNAAKIAQILGKQSDYQRFTALATNIAKSLNTQFLNKNCYAGCSQADQSFALNYGFAPEDQKQSIFAQILSNIVQNQNHLTSGIFGIRYELDELSKFGRTDIALQILNQRTYPSYGYMIDNNATSLWEIWAFSDNIYSNNHAMFGSVSGWFFENLAGISPSPDSKGFDRFKIQPRITGTLRQNLAKYDSVRGEIVSYWTFDNGYLNLTVTIPPNTEASVYFPTTKQGQTFTSTCGQPNYYDNKEVAYVWNLGSGLCKFGGLF